MPQRVRKGLEALTVKGDSDAMEGGGGGTRQGNRVGVEEQEGAARSKL